MFLDSGSWRHFEVRFRALPDGSEDLRAIPDDARQKEWSLSGGPPDDRQRALRHKQFQDLAREAGIAAGVPNRESALNGWLNLLREESPHYRRLGEGGVIQSLCLASAEQCEAFAIQSRELEIAAQSGDRPGLRRDRYRVISWLNGDQESLANANEERKRRESQAWQAYRNRIEEYQQIIKSQLQHGLLVWPGRGEKLSEAVTGLAYDLALLLANDLLDRGLRGVDLTREFRGDAETRVCELTATWRGNLEQLALPVPDSASEMPDLSRAFDRVATDLKHLDELLDPASPQNPVPADEGRPPAAGAAIQDEAPPTKERMAAWRRDFRRRTAQRAALELALGPRLAAEAELRRESANAVQNAWPRDIDHLEQVLWPSVSKYAEKVFDAIAEVKLKSLESKFLVRRYVHFVRCHVPSRSLGLCWPRPSAMGQRKTHSRHNRRRPVASRS